MNNEKPAKLIGAMKHLLNELEKAKIINHIDKEHLILQYVRGKIVNFGHLAEWLMATSDIGRHNYDQIINYGRRYGEVR